MSEHQSNFVLENSTNDDHSAAAEPHNETVLHAQHDRCASPVGHCEKGLIIPIWEPAPGTISSWERFGRAVVFLIPMIYLFLGVSIVADKFVTAIEVIVSKKRKVKVVSKTTGSETYVHIPIWNETVAHLTLFVLGNCAPEILLSAIEIVNRDFKEGELGPGTIIGSGAYNLFVITGICCMSVRNGKTLRLHELRIFFVTAFWLIFAYLWLYIIIMVSSKGVIEVWEAFLTLGFFPIFVVTAYLADKRCFGGCDRCKRGDKIGSIELTSESSGEQLVDDERPKTDVEKALEALERREKRFLQIMFDVKKKHPNLTMAQQREVAELEILKEEPKSLNFYRMAASRGLSGGSVINKEKLRNKIAADENSRKRFQDPWLQIISFDPAEYSIMENVGTFSINVVREGTNLNNSISVAYETQDGTGKAGVDYKPKSGRITFKNNEKLKEIPIHIIDDDTFNMDTQFFVVISNPYIVSTARKADMDKVKLSIKENGTAKITKLDDDHGGIFTFDNDEITVSEDCENAKIKISRNSGAKGDVVLPVFFKPLTARFGVDYDDTDVKEVIFRSGETSNVVNFKVNDHGNISHKRVTLEIELGEPEWMSAEKRLQNQRDTKRLSKRLTMLSVRSDIEKIAPPAIDVSKLGKPKLGGIKSIVVTITENPELKRAVDDIANTDMSNLMGSSWSSQFKEAIAIPSGEDDEFSDNLEKNETSGSTKRSWKDYLFHFVTVFWKVLFAFVPPPGMGQGWPAFFSCLVFIGVLIAIIGDLAIYLGCTIGMRDEITAITFVSLGTSLPDMFASRIAAMREDKADAAIGHVTASCAANIFLGIGLSWSIGSFKQALDGNVGLEIRPGSLSFTITLFFSLGSVALFLLLIRRLPPIRGELGGKTIPRVCTALFLWLLWGLYVVLSALDSYCIISTF